MLSRAARAVVFTAVVALLSASGAVGVRSAAAGDWFVTVVTAGPGGAENWRVQYETTGKATGDHVAFGLVVSAGGQSSGNFVQGFGSTLILGVNAGPAKVEEEVVPVKPDAYSRTLVATGAGLAPGQKAYVLSFASGTNAQAGPITATATKGSVSASMTVGSGSKALLLFDRSDGAAAEALAVGAGSTTHAVMSPGLVGGSMPCEACTASWISADGRRGDNSGNGVFASPSGRFTLSWLGVSNPGLGRPTVAAYAPIGNLWDSFQQLR
jgi:hypothetical protein